MYNSRCAVKLLFMLCCMLMAMHHHARSSFAETAGQQPAAGEAKSDAAEGAAKDGQESRRPLIARNINRIQYRVPLNDGESSLQQGSFIQFNNQFFIAEYVELLSQPGKGADMEDPNYNFELTAGRPLMPGHETGKIIRWLGRIQASTGETTVFSAGVQWDITDSAAIRDLARSWKMSCFIQVFPLKTHPRDNGMDVYAWLQLKNLSSWFYVRGGGGYYFLPDRQNLVFTFWDLIFPVHSRFDLYARYAYQDQDAFNKSEGSQVFAGVRYNFKL